MLRRAQDGDLAAFSRIVLDHQSAALRLATLITGDSTEAYDIVQEAFVKLAMIHLMARRLVKKLEG